MQLLDINNLGPKEIAQTIDEIQRAAADYPELKQITSLYQGRKWRRIRRKIDRNKAKLLWTYSRKHILRTIGIYGRATM